MHIRHTMTPALADRIRTCWSLPASAAGGRSFHELFPGGSTDLVFRYSDAGCRLVLLGPATHKAHVEVDEAACYLGVRFRPGQAPRLADLHPAETLDAALDLDRLGGLPVQDLAEQLLALPDHAARQRRLEALLLPLPPLVRDERCRRAALLLDAHAGRLRAEELAHGLGLHRRSLERAFRAHLGLSPKRLLRLTRFQHLLTRLHAGEHLRQRDGLARLAAECGFADQAHMIRDFRQLSGHTPGSLRPGDMARVDRPDVDRPDVDRPDATVVHAVVHAPRG